MKQYKIVKHHISPRDYMYRIYERNYLFFWKKCASLSTIEQAKSHIDWMKACKLETKEIDQNTPKPETIAYI